MQARSEYLPGVSRGVRRSVGGFYLPMLIGILVAFNPFLKHYGLDYVYAAALVLGIGVGFAQGLYKGRLASNALLIAYIGSVWIMAMVQIFLGAEAGIVGYGVLVTAVIPSYWAVFASRYGKEEFDSLASAFLNIFFVIALLGFVQYFVSPDLFGYIEGTSTSIGWASRTDFENYATFLRASSVTGSPQVFGLLMALAAIQQFETRGVRGLRNLAFLGAFIGAALLSGNKSVYLIGLVYVVWKISSRHNRTELVRAGAFGVVAILVLVPSAALLRDRVPIIERVTSFAQAFQQEQANSRLQLYSEIINVTPPLIGVGWGYATNRQSIDFRAPESQVLKVYYEGGILPAVLLLALLVRGVASSGSAIMRRYRPVMVAALVSVFVVHAFDSPFFFLAWGMIALANNVQARSPRPARAALTERGDAAHRKLSNRSWER